MEGNNRLIYTILLTAIIFCLTACSTTKKLAEDEVLYTGVKKIKVETPEGVKLKGNQKSNITSPLNVKPNNPLFSPYVRTPLPIGLWVYNWNIKKEKGFKYWLYKKLAKEPVLMTDVQPDLRLEMVKNNAKNYGFFNPTTYYEILPHRRNPKKVRYNYYIQLDEPFYYTSIELVDWPNRIDTIVRPIMPLSYLKEGDQYDIFIMQEERERLATRLRNRGYYYFSANQIEYLADTTRQHGEMDIRIAIKPGTPNAAFYPYYINDVNVSLLGDGWLQNRDSILYDSVKISYVPPETIKPKVLARAIKVRPDELYSSRRESRTRSELVKLGIFRYVNVDLTPVDTMFVTDTLYLRDNYNRRDTLPLMDTIISRNLNYNISADFSLPIETEVELDVSSKSNNLVGPAVSLRFSNKNMFRRAETFTLQFTGAYEWQVGGGKRLDNSGIINSYELGLNMGLSVPRLLLPRFLTRKSELQESTQFQLGADLLNRNRYFRMVSFWGSAKYDFNSSRRHFHSVVPFKLNYTYLLKTSPVFDSTLMANPAVELSFRNQFIPSMSYTYTYDRQPTFRNPNRLFWQSYIAQAGNIISGLQALGGNTGEGRKIFRNRYSQFIKFTSEFIKYNQIGANGQLAYRLMGGIGYAYGNSRVMPYSEQFYAGGSMTLRAFQIRSIGPGSYYPRVRTSTSYLDQTGDVQIEGNIEYRFKMGGRLFGAVFIDTGNVWLVRKDPKRPGGQITMKKLWDELALGTGFGIRYDITYLIIRADLGVALHAPYDTGKSGYFNINKYNFNDALVLNIAIGYPF